MKKKYIIAILLLVAIALLAIVYTCCLSKQQVEEKEVVLLADDCEQMDEVKFRNGNIIIGFGGAQTDSVLMMHRRGGAIADTLTYRKIADNEYVLQQFDLKKNDTLQIKLLPQRLIHIYGFQTVIEQKQQDQTRDCNLLSCIVDGEKTVLIASDRINIRN